MYIWDHIWPSIWLVERYGKALEISLNRAVCYFIDQSAHA